MRLAEYKRGHDKISLNVIVYHNLVDVLVRMLVVLWEKRDGIS
jgi:hypothetical protein